MGAAYVRKYFDIPTELSDQLKEVCAKTEQTQSKFVRDAITEKVNRSNKPEKGKK